MLYFSVFCILSLFKETNMREKALLFSFQLAKKTFKQRLVNFVASLHLEVRITVFI